METEDLSLESLNKKTDKLMDFLIENGPKLLAAILVVIIGFWLIKRLLKILNHVFEKRNISQEVRPYLLSIVGVLLKILVVLSAAGIVGIQTSSFIALLAAAGFAVGMALQGSLGNFAAGVMILIFKPYRVGDLIGVCDEKGWVTEIQIFNTILQTVTNETVIIPNAKAIDDKIINYSTIGNIRVDVHAHIPYAENFNKVKGILMQVVNSHDKILSDPAPNVLIDEYDSHSIKILVNGFSTPQDYWAVYYDITAGIKGALGDNNIKVAYSEGVELGDIGKEQ